MLSKILTASRNVKNLSGGVKSFIVRNNNINNNLISQNVISKRWSGHNAMDITPSNFYWKYFKNMAHFYALITMVPCLVITTIINIRANPELTEIPEGYEPRYWEYYKHPITRFMARYFYRPMELDHELFMSMFDDWSQNMIMRDIQREAEQIMTFYQDHRSSYFRPYYGEYFRIGREDMFWGEFFSGTKEGHHIDEAYKLNNIPLEGYRPEYVPED